MIQSMFRAILFSLLGSAVAAAAKLDIDHNAPSVLRTGNKVVLQSPSFSLQLDITDGLHAEMWENRITGRTLAMGHGSEVEFDIGLPGQALITPVLTVAKAPAAGYSPGGEAAFELASREPKAVVTITYRWDAKHPVLHKQAVIRNTGTTVWNRLLDVRLGDYATDAATVRDPDWPVRVTKMSGSAEWDSWADPAGRERGYPAYPENQFFIGLAHPSGFVLLQDQHLRLLHHPGLKLEPAKEFACMEAVYGVAQTDAARAAFRNHLYSRMRRVLRGHDRPYAIIATCGAQGGTDEAYDFTALTEASSLDHISRMAEGQRSAGLHWDYYDIEFWHDPAGDLKTPDAKRFPHGFAPILSELVKLGATPGLWLSSGCTPSILSQGGIDTWTIGRNPAVQECGTDGVGKGRLCRATEPANRMHIDGLIHQIRTNKIGLIKLDNNGEGSGEGIYPWCNNPKHEHLPGDWSIEANHNAQIELLKALDHDSPALFIMLYWGHRSPWWLLYGDTIFDVGMRMEMDSLATTPALYARSSNVRMMDQARRMVKDLPALGWDSLGLSLSRWAWNNRLGAEHWQEGVLMDLCRGQLLAHIWSDPGCFPVADRPQMAEFLALLKARPDCFAHPRFIGDARTDDVWGYCCSDGSRAMIAIDNGSWHDHVVPLELNSAWGLPDQGKWDVYCWYPKHVRFTTGDKKTFGSRVSIALRPFSQVLLELVPAGKEPTLNRTWERLPMPKLFTEASSDVAVVATAIDKGKTQAWTIRGEIPPSKAAGWFAITAEFHRGGQPFLSLNNGPTSLSGSLVGQPAVFQPVLDNPLFPAPWQTYRLWVEAADSARPFELAIAVGLPKNVAVTFAGHFVPGASTVAQTKR